MGSVTELIFDRPSDVCDVCGEIVQAGDWPFCASPANPEGHTRGAYGWRMRMSMKTQGWTRRVR